MSMIPYTYSVVRYVHDPAAGEQLNVGVILCAPSEHFFEAKFEYRFERLSEAFADFNGEHYRRVLKQIAAAIADLRERTQGGLFPLREPPADVTRLVSLLMPDGDLSIQFSLMLAGVTDNPEAELEDIFERMILSQYPRQRIDKRTDEEVWTSVYQRPLIQHRVKKYLQPKQFESSDYELRFDHAFKNNHWHVLHPTSMDYARPEGIQAKATRVLGKGTALSGNPELGTLYLLMGKPQERKYMTQYIKAKNLLHKMPIKHVIVEEDEAEDFAQELESYLREHGLIEGGG